MNFCDLTINSHTWLLIFILAIIWTIPWKGVALWRSAKNGQKVWFIVMLLINTLAILEIIYIFFFSKKDQTRGYNQQSIE